MWLRLLCLRPLMQKTTIHILDPKQQHGDECKLLLAFSDATIDTKLLPTNDVSILFTDPQVLIDNKTKCYNRSMIGQSFTSSEDNLILRGVVSFVFTTFVLFLSQ